MHFDRLHFVADLIMEFDYKPLQICDLDEHFQSDTLKSAEIRRANKVKDQWFLVLHSIHGDAYVLADEFGVITYGDVSKIEEVIAALPKY